MEFVAPGVFSIRFISRRSVPATMRLLADETLLFI